MKKVFKLSLLMLAMLTMAPETEAQQIVYVNSALILSEMPEVEHMRSNLEAFSCQLLRKGQQLV